MADEGAIFTDYYGEQSCTAGRATFITGQSPFRVGLTKVGMPGAKQGISDKDPTLAQLLKPHGYTSGQFGKNHLGDRNEYLPTVHGFDEYAGVLYHLNALEEPENVDYPKDPSFFERFGPRNVIHTWATDRKDRTEDPRFGVVGKQKIKDLGPMTIERMKTYDDETLEQSRDFIRRAVEADKPFFVWHNTTRTHTFTHLRKKYADMIPEKGLMGAAMTELDDTVGALLQELEDLGVADNTIVVFTSDNGAMKFSWARWWDLTFPGRESDNMGGRRTCAGDGALAGRCEARHRDKRYLPSQRLVPGRCCGRPVNQISKRSCSRDIALVARPIMSISTATTRRRFCQAKAREHGSSFTTSLTMVITLRSVTTNGRLRS